MSFPRYPRYKDSGVEWLGQVPEHWAVKPLKTVSTHNDDVLDETTAPDTEIAYVDISSVDAVNGISAKETMLFSAAPSRARRRVKHGDVIVSTVRTYLRAIARIREPEDNLVVSTGFAVVRPRETLVPDFLGNVLSTSYFVEQVIARSTGVSYPAINASELVAIPVTVPPTDEQTAIAAFLDQETGKIDELVAEQRRLMGLLKEKRQAVISHAVTRGLNPVSSSEASAKEDAPLQPSGIEWLGDVPKHWAAMPVKYLAKVGNGSTPSREVPEYWAEAGYPWLNSSVVNLPIVTEAEGFVTERALRECHLPIIVPPAVLVGITGQGRTRGMAALLGIEATINQHVAYVKPMGTDLDVFYLLRAFETAYLKLRRDSEEAGATKGAITCEQIGNLKIPVPPLAEQHAIANFLDTELAKFDTLTAEAQRAIALLQERRTALISAAVTGQIDVRAAVPN